MGQIGYGAGPALLALALGAACLYLVRYCGAAPSWPGSLTKTLSVAGLALAASVAGPVWLAVALWLGAAGDLALSRPGERAFLAGVGAFGLSHLAYVALFLGQGADPVRAVTGPLAPVAMGLSGLTVLLGAALWRRAGALRGPVLVYAAVIAAMGIAALGLPVSGSSPPYALAQVAAGLFILSDSLIAAERFLLPSDHRAAGLVSRAIWVTYWLAQALFLATFALAGPA
jgi:uncharacterized membrane protein YhhN